MEILSNTSLIYVSLGIIFIFLLWVIRLEIKLNRFTKGNSAVNLEDAIMKTFS